MGLQEIVGGAVCWGILPLGLGAGAAWACYQVESFFATHSAELQKRCFRGLLAAALVSGSVGGCVAGRYTSSDSSATAVATGSADPSVTTPSSPSSVEAEGSARQLPALAQHMAPCGFELSQRSDGIQRLLLPVMDSKEEKSINCDRGEYWGEFSYEGGVAWKSKTTNGDDITITCTGKDLTLNIKNDKGKNEAHRFKYEPRKLVRDFVRTVYRSAETSVTVTGTDIKLKDRSGRETNDSIIVGYSVDEMLGKCLRIERSRARGDVSGTGTHCAIAYPVDLTTTPPLYSGRIFSGAQEEVTRGTLAEICERIR